VDVFAHDWLELAPTAHLQFDHEPVYTVERGIKTAQQAYAKWLANTSAASGANGSWATNLGSTTKPIVDAAVAQKTVMTTNFQRAVNDGKWEANLRAVGDAGIKSAAKAKADNYGTGTAENSPGAQKMNTALVKIVAYETANLPTIYAMAKGTLAAGKARMNAWADIMAAGAGTFG
jgi:hypothetical protein